MCDSRLNVAERRLQHSFRLVMALCLILLIFLPLRGDIRDEGPDRVPGPEREAKVRYEPLSLDRGTIGPLKLAGAWRVEIDEPRAFGLSALAVTSTGLLALTDSGVLIELPRPGTARVARLRELPDGPGWPTYRRFRDSESLAFDSARNGWWVGFENRHSLWFYDRQFRRALTSRWLTFNWPLNKGLEGLTLNRGEPLLLPESGQLVLQMTSRGLRRMPLTGARGNIADALQLPNGRTIVSQRQIGLSGITNRLGWLERTKVGYQVRSFATLPLGPLDNVEGLAAERLPSGTTRVWAVTDNDGWRRTVLLAFDLPKQQKPPAI
jgi:hypothetical protein